MEVTKNELVAFFHRHLVPICLVFTIENKAAVYVATAFVLSAQDEWFLVTAGHVALDIKSYLENPKYCLEKVLLYDYGGSGAVHYEPIPFELISDNIIILGDETTLDYSVIHLRPHYKNLLIANNIEPLNEEVWLKQPQNPDFFWMIGVPRQMVSVEWNNDANSAINQINIVTTLIQVKHAIQRPVGLAKRSSARWYGYAKLVPPIDDISGMSGAPIFAFKQSDSGELRYWLIGIQSSWNRGNKAIAACLTHNLGGYLTEAINQFKNWQANQTNTADEKSLAVD